MTLASLFGARRIGCLRASARSAGFGDFGVPDSSRPRVRLASGDSGYGWYCDCGEFKNKQHRMCMTCWRESLRGDDYWARRTCECGRPKSRSAQVCRSCADERLRGVSVPGRVQPADHPWRKVA
jgi:hypothetical protein